MSQSVWEPALNVKAEMKESCRRCMLLFPLSLPSFPQKVFPEAGMEPDRLLKWKCVAGQDGWMDGELEKKGRIRDVPH